MEVEQSAHSICIVINSKTYIKEQRTAVGSEKEEGISQKDDAKIGENAWQVLGTIVNYYSHLRLQELPNMTL